MIATVADTVARTVFGPTRTRRTLLTAHLIALVIVGLASLAVALAAPAAAGGGHGKSDVGHHVVAGAGQHRASVTASVPAGLAAPRNGLTQAVAMQKSTVSDPIFATGHDKCRKPKGDRGAPPWCADPGAGWLGSTSNQADTNHHSSAAAQMRQSSATAHASGQSRR